MLLCSRFSIGAGACAPEVLVAYVVDLLYTCVAAALYLCRLLTGHAAVGQEEAAVLQQQYMRAVQVSLCKVGVGGPAAGIYLCLEQVLSS
jgi:hypothetical protein